MAQQLSGKYTLRQRLVAWTLAALILGGAGYAAWNAILEGKILRVVIGVGAAAFFAWRSSRDAGQAKSR